MAGGSKIIIYCLVIAAALAAYLALAHFFIFYRIRAAGLKAPDRQEVYLVGGDKADAKNLSYAALGDSLTAGVGATKYEESYPYLLAEQLAAGGENEITLKNFSYPGARATDLINDLLPSAIAVQPEMITILIGVNDVYGNFSLSSFEKKYTYILDQLTKKTSAKIYLIGLPYIGSPKLLSVPYNYYYYYKLGEFNDVIRGLAAIYNLKYIDLAAASAEFNNYQAYYARDLFHPSALGYQLWSRIIYDGINQ